LRDFVDLMFGAQGQIADTGDVIFDVITLGGNLFFPAMGGYSAPG
jgi:hypothetical protein